MSVNSTRFSSMPILTSGSIIRGGVNSRLPTLLLIVQRWKDFRGTREDFSRASFTIYNVPGDMVAQYSGGIVGRDWEGKAEVPWRMYL